MMRFLAGFLLTAILLLLGCSAELNQPVAVLEEEVNASLTQLTQDVLSDKEEVKHQLKLMYVVDQKLRSSYLENHKGPKIKALIDKVRILYTSHLKTIIAHYGWMKISEFGKDADHQAWLLVQHADHDIDFQTNCVNRLQRLLPLKETDPKNYAYLQDRVASNKGLRQHYGTQTEKKAGKWELKPFEGTLEDINRRRGEVGLESIEAYLETIQRMYQK